MIRNGTEQTALSPGDGMRIYRLDVACWLTYDAIVGGVVRDAAQLPAAGLTHKPRSLQARLTTAGFADSVLTAVGGWSAQTGDDGGTTGLAISGNTITATYAGLYRITFSMFFASNATGIRQISLWKNATFSGSTITGGTQVALQQVGGAVGSISVIVHAEVVLAAGDTMTPGLQQTSGVSLTCGSTTAGVVYWHMVRDDD
jgi:hypothetical protein